ncbi:hypothetical protein Agub_g4868 [Astrephomene gubernaculifera]|uniref:Uncharacterized protein n=1 Tax=Astrephomene gubernaculifera TaxID=47775 RepID=A0AAD3DPW8_9CHLO|nr:hypothetical protein Agub_g4868 [Astrephomene gubernaculifera]
MAQPIAGWLFRSSSWIPAASRAITFSNSGCIAINYVATGSSCSSDNQPVGWPSYAPASFGSPSYRSYSAASTAVTTSGAAEASAASTPSSSAASGGFALPKWLRTMFPGGKDLGPAVGAKAVSPSSSGASSSEGSATTDAEDMKQLEELRNMTMEGYVDYCKKLRSGSAPPRPRRPPMARDHYDYITFQDTRRVTFLRLQQHERIGSLITKEESDLILAKREEILRDRALLEAIADRTGVYIDLEVKDCIQQFLETRERSEHFYRYAKEFGQPMPKTGEEQRAAVKYMKRVEAEEELGRALARRDTGACPLRNKLPWASASAVCELTGLRYWECCGRASAGAGDSAAQPAAGQEQLPQPLQHLKRRKEHVVEKGRERDAYVKFGSRAEHRLRKAYITAMKPRFRDY